MYISRIAYLEAVADVWVADVVLHQARLLWRIAMRLDSYVQHTAHTLFSFGRNAYLETIDGVGVADIVLHQISFLGRNGIWLGH